MGVDRLRVLLAAAVSLALIITSAWTLDWFTMRLEFGGIDELGIGLRSVRACGVGGCETAPLSLMPKNMYTTTSTVTLWSSVLLVIVILLQAASRIATHTASLTFTRLGYVVGVGVFLTAFVTAYFFGPEVGDESVDVMDFSLGFVVKRTWAPSLLMLGIVAGMFSLYYSTARDDDMTMALEAPLVDLAPARVLRYREPPIVAPEPAPVAPAIVADSQPPPSGARPAHALRGKLQFAIATAEVTRGGIDARREVGSNVLVVWRDVVGVVARRMPPEYDGGTFVDLVSTSGSTLRIVPWTRLAGDPIASPSDDGVARARAFIELVLTYCPTCALDRATRTFVDSANEDAAQLPDLDTLTAHDARLA